MTKDRFLAQVLLHIETARDIDINRHLETAFAKLNEHGKKRNGIITVDFPSGEETGSDPALRTATQGFNYYEDLRCLILPTELLSIGGVYYNDCTTPLEKATLSEYNMNVMPTLSYVVDETHVMYLSFDAEDGDTFTIDGYWSVHSLELLPDFCEHWLLMHILAGMYLQAQYRDINLHKYYKAEAERALLSVKSAFVSVPNWTPRSGVLL